MKHAAILLPATLLGCALAWGGLVVPALKPLYDYAWFVGAFGAGGVYFALMHSKRDFADSGEPRRLR